jgi:D-alanine-D-alanine ligase
VTDRTHPANLPSVLVLGGGPDAERDVSLNSARAIADALAASGHRVERRTIERISADELSRMPGEVIFPALHGGWGEGGPLQDILESDGRPFIGSASLAARRAMDKIATKMVAIELGIPTPAAHILDARDGVCPMELPAVIKPVHEGSTIGLFLCRTPQEWTAARAQIADEAAQGESRTYMIEPMIGAAKGSRGRELTVGLLDGRALPVIEIVPAEGLYDYEAKYTRDDTQYLVDPELPAGVTERIKEQTVRIARALGVRHIARTDFMLDTSGTAWFLEINTMPGFTDHSLVPKAARKLGLEMPELCATLVRVAVRDHPRRPQQSAVRAGAHA